MSFAVVRSSLLVALLLAVVSSSAPAQQTPTFGETIEVRIANVDVVVTRSDGTRVRGLQRDDFEILEDGIFQAITNFHEVSGEEAPPGTVASVEPPPSPRRNNVIIVIDADSLEPARRNEAIGAVRRFVRTSLRPGDQAMLAVFERRMRIPLPFTSDASRLDEELDRLTRSSAGGLTQEKRIAEMKIRSTLQEAESGRGGAAAVRAAYAVSLTHGAHFGEQLRKRTVNLADALVDLFRATGGVEGKKVLLFVGETFPQYPSLGMIQYVNDLFARHMGALQSAFVSPQAAAGTNSLTSLPAAVVRAANANEIAVNVIYTGESAGPSDGDRSPSQRGVQQFLEFNNNSPSLSAIAGDTGGVALIGSRNFDRAADQMGEDLRGYYSLGYRVAGGAAARKLEVRTRDRSLRVRARRSAVVKPFDEEIADRVAATLYQPVSGESAVKLVIGTVKRERRGLIRVPLEVIFPSSLLTLVPRGEKVVGGFDIVTAASDDENRLSGAQRQSQEVAFDTSAVPPTISFRFESVLRDRMGAIAVGVVDRTSRTAVYARAAMK